MRIDAAARRSVNGRALGGSLAAGNPMLEVERKYAVVDAESMRRILLDAGATRLRQETQIDRYYRHPARDFAVSDEAVRIRHIDQQTWLTYKGPRAKSQTKIREEIEVQLKAPEDEAKLAVVLQRLGFELLAVVQKERGLYEWQSSELPTTVCLDAVVDLGNFLEIEVVADPARRAQAEQIVLAVQDRLQLGSPISESYLKMLLDRQSL